MSTMFRQQFSLYRVLEAVTNERRIRLEILGDSGGFARDDEQVVFEDAGVRRFLRITAIAAVVHEHMMSRILLRSHRAISEGRAANRDGERLLDKVDYCYTARAVSSRALSVGQPYAPLSAESDRRHREHGQSKGANCRANPSPEFRNCPCLPPTLPRSDNMPPKSNKRPATRASAAKPKKARLSVPESETEQVKNIEQYRRPMKDAAVYYIDDFIGGGDTKLASDLYEKLLKIDGCKLHFLAIRSFQAVYSTTRLIRRCHVRRVSTEAQNVRKGDYSVPENRRSVRILR